MSNLHKRILSILESLDEAEAHGVVSNGQCARYRYWEQFDSTKGTKDEPECTCEIGRVILELSEEAGSRCVRYRRAGKRFGELPARQMAATVGALFCRRKVRNNVNTQLSPRQL